MLFDIERLPGAPQLHRWADWAELLVISSATGSLSLSEFAETTERRTDFIDSEAEDDQDAREEVTESLIGTSQEEPSAYRDALNKRAADVLVYMTDRSSRYGEAYPFDVNVDEKLITLRETNDPRRAYVFLLVCATLRYVKKPARTNLTSRFEIMCLQVLRNMLPANSEIHLFGANSIHSSKYGTLLYDKILLLAEDLGEKPLVRRKDFEAGDQGDNGLDLVAWIPSNDKLPGALTIFGQAACTPHWVSKQHSSHSSSWSRSITLIVDPLNMVFIPYDYRAPGDEWYTERHIHKSVVMDRGRMLNEILNKSDLAKLALSAEFETLLDLESLDEIRGLRANDL